MGLRIVAYRRKGLHAEQSLDSPKSSAIARGGKSGFTFIAECPMMAVAGFPPFTHLNIQLLSNS